MEKLINRLNRLKQEKYRIELEISRIESLLEKKDEHAYLRDTPIEFVDFFPVHFKNVLNQINVYKLGDLEKYSLKHLSRHRNVGKLSLEAVKRLEREGVIQLIPE